MLFECSSAKLSGRNLALLILCKVQARRFDMRLIVKLLLVFFFGMAIGCTKKSALNQNNLFNEPIRQIEMKADYCKQLKSTELPRLCDSKPLTDCSVAVAVIDRVLAFEASISDLRNAVHSTFELFRSSPASLENIQGFMKFWALQSRCEEVKRDLWRIVINSLSKDGNEIPTELKEKLSKRFINYVDANQKDVVLLQVALLLVDAKNFAETNVLGEKSSLIKDKIAGLKQEMSSSPEAGIHRKSFEEEGIAKPKLIGKIKSRLHIELDDDDYDLNAQAAKEKLMREHKIAEEFATRLRGLF
jgi:hypothetical protein